MDVKANLNTILQSIPKEVTLVAVSKTRQNSAIIEAYQLGQRIFGENKVQEAKQKWSGLKDSLKDLELHLIGGLQSNKSKEAVQLFDYIHSVDSIKLASQIKLSAEEAVSYHDPVLRVNFNVMFCNIMKED